jgi:hypothetical protein
VPNCGRRDNERHNQTATSTIATIVRTHGHHPHEWINKPIIRRFLSQEGVDVAKAQREYWRQADDVQVNLLLSILNKG